MSRLFYRYEEGDGYEERLGDRLVEGEILARRTVAILEGELRRVAAPQGTFSRNLRTGQWREIAVQQAKLSVARDGTATLTPARRPARARRSPPPSATRGKLGIDESGARRPDRHLPAIAALIDPRQFELITQPSSGLIAVQGSAGSGKTTIGLHRIAYLAFAEPRRFRADRMLVVVYQRALASYVSRVLPSLDVDGVPVMTFPAWAESIRKQTFPLLQAPLTDETPALVMRAKAHGAMLRILVDRQAELARFCETELGRELAGKPGAEDVLAAWTKTGDDHRAGRRAHDRAGAVGARRDARPGHAQRRRGHRPRAAGAHARRRRRVGGAAHRSRRAGRRLRAPRARAVHRGAARRRAPLVRRARPPAHGALVARTTSRTRWIPRTTRSCCASTSCSAAAFPAGKGGAPLSYEHLMVDEVQDFSPVELAVLLETTTAQRSVTMAGDTAQAIAPEHGFSNWSALLDDLGIPHERVEPLRVSYRSTREIVDAAEHVLGPLGGDVRPVAPRAGAPVEAFGFSSAGEASELLSHALKELIRAEPTASVALVARHPEQARLYYDALARAEVPNLRLVADQDFSFTAGIDVTDVRQTKGLEFDIVILLDVNEASYPVSDDARRLLHVAMTRAAHQLWVTYTGAPSLLLARQPALSAGRDLATTVRPSRRASRSACRDRPAILPVLGSKRDSIGLAHQVAAVGVEPPQLDRAGADGDRDQHVDARQLGEPRQRRRVGGRVAAAQPGDGALDLGRAVGTAVGQREDRARRRALSTVILRKAFLYPAFSIST